MSQSPNTAQIDVRLPQHRLREKHRDPPPCDTRSSRSFPATGRIRRLPRTRHKEYKTAGANFQCFLFLTTTDMLFPDLTTLGSRRTLAPCFGIRARSFSPGVIRLSPSSVLVHLQQRGGINASGSGD
jgi:hypothetical protein